MSHNIYEHLTHDEFKIVGELLKTMYKVLGELNEELINYTTIGEILNHVEKEDEDEAKKKEEKEKKKKKKEYFISIYFQANGYDSKTYMEFINTIIQ